MLSENDDVNTTTPLGRQTTQPRVSKIADRRFPVATLLITVIFSLLTLLKAHLTMLRIRFDFSRREQDIIKSFLARQPWAERGL